MHPRNLLKQLPDRLQQELFEPILQQQGILLERIISPPETRSEPLIQPHDEWVMIIQGSAEIAIGTQKSSLTTGDSLLIPAQTSHRVLSTSTAPLCIWLALHLPAPDSH